MAMPSRLQDLGRLARGLGLVAAQGFGELAGTQAGRKAMEGDFAGALVAAAKGGAEVLASLPGGTHTFPAERRGDLSGAEARFKGQNEDLTSAVDQTVASAVERGFSSARELSAQAGIDQYMQGPKQTSVSDLDGSARRAPHAGVGASVQGAGDSLRFESGEFSKASGLGDKINQAGHQLGSVIGQALDPGSRLRLESRVGEAFQATSAALEGALSAEQKAQLSSAMDSASMAVRIASFASSHPDSQLRKILSADGPSFDPQSATREVAEVLRKALAQTPGELSPGLREGLKQGLQISKQVDQQLGLRGQLEGAGKTLAEVLFSWGVHPQTPSKPPGSSHLTAAGFVKPKPGFGSDVWSWIENRSNSKSSASSRSEPGEKSGSQASLEPLVVGTHSPEERLDRLKAMSASEHSERMPSQTDTGTVTFVAPGYEAAVATGTKGSDGQKQDRKKDQSAAEADYGAEERESSNGLASGSGQTGGTNSSAVDPETGVPQKLKSGNAAAIDEPGVAHSKEARARRRAEEAKRKEGERRTKQARERKVPSGPMARVFGFGQMAAGMAFGTLGESAGRLLFGGAPAVGNAFISEGNAERLAAGLARMRGAALKLGQMLSIQDESVIPPQISKALERVRQGADIMPRKQLEKVLTGEQGPGWKSRLAEFDDLPMAAASIGQVHHATLKQEFPGGAYGPFKEVAMKVQYPGVSESIDSDIENMRRILDWTDVIPKGLYLNHTIKIAKVELAAECDYILEAKSQKRYRRLLGDDKDFYVPQVVDYLSSRKVLTTELVPGSSIDNVARADEVTRNRVAERLLRLTLQELFVFRFMQTDPNWGNFLYDEETDRIYLIDFGAARDFPKVFVDNYLEMVRACADRDKDSVIEYSKRLGFLTGDESRVMLDAHCQAAFVVGVPFAKPGGFDFKTTDLTKRVTALGAVMLRHRLTPPPDEAYSLHRKLSGAFLACIKLGATVPCRELFFNVYDNYDFGSKPVAA